MICALSIASVAANITPISHNILIPVSKFIQFNATNVNLTVNKIATIISNVTNIQHTSQISQSAEFYLLYFFMS